MSLRAHRIGWAGACAVALLAPLAISAFHGSLDGFTEGLGGTAGWLQEAAAFALGTLFTVWIVMAVSAALARRRRRMS
ncbi:hypothetical protein [uncultured Algimonas sp.]|uniref:hypothetical protein n=1 Tax=uncultured Algimonas sp. TaxID=1547920 RepID=UPI002634CEDD|nr:hypothetical protein [uncultured Algimonas sp.]